LTNGCGSEETYTDTVQSTSTLVTTAEFTTDLNSYCFGDIVNFSSVNNNSNNTFIWNFGDGNTGLGIEEMHMFGDTGTYLVTLYLTNTCGITDSISNTLSIDTSSSPIAVFTSSPDLYACPNQAVDFTNLSSDTNTVNWNFGDGGNSNMANPNYSYASAGNYFVTLTVTNGCGLSSSRTQLFTISTLDVLEPPTVFCTEMEDSMVFTWDSIKDATGYEVSIDSGLTWIKVPEGVTSYAVPGTSGVTYTLTVRGLGPPYCKFGLVSNPTSCSYIGVGTADNHINKLVWITPNPSSGIFHLKLSNISLSRSSLLIYNLLGEVVISNTNIKSGDVIDISDQPAGVYLCKIETSGWLELHRLVVQ